MTAVSIPDYKPSYTSYAVVSAVAYCSLMLLVTGILAYNRIDVFASGALSRMNAMTMITTGGGILIVGLAILLVKQLTPNISQIRYLAYDNGAYVIIDRKTNIRHPLLILTESEVAQYEEVIELYECFLYIIHQPNEQTKVDLSKVEVRRKVVGSRVSDGTVLHKTDTKKAELHKTFDEKWEEIIEKPGLIPIGLKQLKDKLKASLVLLKADGNTNWSIFSQNDVCYVQQNGDPKKYTINFFATKEKAEMFADYLGKANKDDILSFGNCFFFVVQNSDDRRQLQASDIHFYYVPENHNIKEKLILQKFEALPKILSEMNLTSLSKERLRVMRVQRKVPGVRTGDAALFKTAQDEPGRSDRGSSAPLSQTFPVSQDAPAPQGTGRKSITFNLPQTTANASNQSNQATVAPPSLEAEDNRVPPQIAANGGTQNNQAAEVTTATSQPILDPVENKVPNSGTAPLLLNAADDGDPTRIDPITGEESQAIDWHESPTNFGAVPEAPPL